MVKIYGKGDTVSSSEFWDGRTNNNLLQDFTTNDINSLKDIIQPIKEIIEQSSEIQDMIERTTPTSTNGVYSNSLKNECIMTTSDVVSIAIMGGTKYYARLPPGIIQFGGNIFINKPATVLASKQIEKILKIERTNLESVEIKYSYETDSFKCKISKKFTTGNPSIVLCFPSLISWEDDSVVGYTHSATLLAAIIADTSLNSYFVKNIGNDITKINLENLVELTSTGTYYWVMNSSGNLELTKTLLTNFRICQFTYNSIPITSIDNTHTIVKVSSELSNGTAQYQLPITGATPYAHSWSTALNLVGPSGLNSLAWASGNTFVKMTAAGTFELDTSVYSISTHVHGNITNIGTIPVSGNVLGILIAAASTGVINTLATNSTATTYLNGNGAWSTPPDTNTWTALTSTVSGYVVQGSVVDLRKNTIGDIPTSTTSSLTLVDTSAIASGVGGSIWFGSYYTGTTVPSQAAFIKGYKETAVDSEFGYGLKFGTRSHNLPSAVALTITGFGNVGIGSVAPLDKVEVAGNVRINSSAGIVGFQIAFDSASKTLNFNYVGT